MEQIEQFAKSNEGQAIILLHDLGYRLADGDISKLTSTQINFLIAGMAERNRRASQNNDNSELKGKMEAVRRRVKAKYGR